MLIRNKSQVLKTNTLIGLMEISLSGNEVPRDFKVIHASTLTSDYIQFCPREYALLDITGKPQFQRYISTAMRVTFDNGEALHNLARNKWLRNTAIGTWLCNKCGGISSFSKYPVEGCNNCCNYELAYEEVEFTSQETGVVGNIDLIVDLGMPKYEIVEIKTIDKDQFNDLKFPLAEHRVRTALYLKIIQDSVSPYKNLIYHDRARILYISKGFGLKNAEFGKVLPFKEFEVDVRGTNLDMVWKQALDVKAYKENKRIPFGVCPTGTCKRARECSVVKECFSGKYKAT